MKLPLRNWDKKQWFRFVVLLLVSIFILAWVGYLTHLVLKLNDEQTRLLFEEKMTSLGIWGWFAILIIQFVQIVLAFIPGGPIQIIAGSLYGPIGGAAVCLLGTALASTVIFMLTEKFGYKVVSLFVGDKNIKSYRFLRNEKRLNSLVFFLFLIPGTPKDALTYLVALTKMPLKQFLIITLVARMPGVFTSVFAGKYIIEKNWYPAAVSFIVMGVLSVFGLLIYKKIIERKSKE